MHQQLGDAHELHVAPVDATNSPMSNNPERGRQVLVLYGRVLGPIGGAKLIDRVTGHWFSLFILPQAHHRC